MRMCHELKIAPRYYTDIVSKKKTFEIRKNDRNFQVGDEVKLKEWSDGEFTHAPVIYGIIGYISDYEQKENFVVLGIDFSLDNL